MEKQPLISVVVPCYNRAATIGAALQSIQAQTYPHWEAIVVDDGSTDGSSAVVEQLSREDTRMRLFRHKQNRLAQAARNTGIRAANGDWIAFLDSDDQFLPDSLEARLEVARSKNVLVVHSDCNMIQLDGSRKRYGVPPVAGHVYRRLLEGEGPTFPGLLVHKDSLRRINFLDERIVAFQEWDTAIRLAKYYPFGFEERPTFVWDCRNSDAISKDMLRGGRGYEQVFHKHYFPILRHLGPGAFARHYRIAAGWYRAGGDQRAVRRCLVMASLWSSVDPKRALRRLGRLLINGRAH